MVLTDADRRLFGLTLFLQTQHVSMHRTDDFTGTSSLSLNGTLCWQSSTAA